MVHTARVSSLLGVFEQYAADVVVNCGGLLGGVELEGDKECYPIRGQVGGVVWGEETGVLYVE